MPRISVTATMDMQLEAEEGFERFQLEQIMHEDIRPVSHTKAVDVVDYSVKSYIINLPPNTKEETPVVTIHTADDMHQELFEALRGHEDHTLTVSCDNKTVTLRCADCSKTVILVETPIVEFSRCVKITIHGKANLMEIDDDGDIERAITEQLQNGLKIETESTVNGIDIDDTEIDEVRPG